MPNLHCHAFQKGMAGLAERRGPVGDSFWTWREVMYRFSAQLTPDDVEAIAAYAYMQMLETGYTNVGEFHYLHHDPAGRPYADIGEMAARIASASATTGIGLTLLPSLYTYGGFGGAAPNPGQIRFINPTDRFVTLMARSREIVAALPGATIGIAPHSLRAVSPQQLREVAAIFADGPVHIHAAEQTREVEDCIASLGARPVQWLLDEMGDRRALVPDPRHAHDRRRNAAARAVRRGRRFVSADRRQPRRRHFQWRDCLAADGRFGIGTDSNIQIDAPAELRQLEYSQRLKHRARNVMTTEEGESTGRSLYTRALAGGAQALGQPIGAIGAGTSRRYRGAGSRIIPISQARIRRHGAGCAGVFRRPRV